MSGKGVTTKQLADAVGLSLSYMTRIVNGQRRLKRNPVMRHDIAKALGVPTHWIEVERPDPEAVAS
jgi:transcriptional regulator with XRE-family HTH domain